MRAQRHTRARRAGEAHPRLPFRLVCLVFPTSHWGEPDADDWKLVETMSSYWTQFAKTGDPNQVGHPAWPVYDPEKEQCLEIGVEVKPRAIPHLEKFAAFEQSLQARIAVYQKPGSAEEH